MLDKLLLYFDNSCESTFKVFLYWNLQSILISDYFQVLIYKHVMDPTKFSFYVLYCQIGKNYNCLRFKCIMNFKPYCLFNDYQRQKLSQTELISRSIEQDFNFKVRNVQYYYNNEIEKIKTSKDKYLKLKSILEKDFDYEIETDVQKMILYLS